MPWFCSPFSNFYLHLRLPVTASKQQLSFVHPYLSSILCANKIWRSKPPIYQIWRPFLTTTVTIRCTTMLPSLATMFRLHINENNFEQHCRATLLLSLALALDHPIFCEDATKAWFPLNGKGIGDSLQSSAIPIFHLRFQQSVYIRRRQSATHLYHDPFQICKGI